MSTIAYTYGDTNWKDKLTAYNGKSITYDAIGNPLSYDGWTYTWENGRQLKSLSNASTSLSFKYNSDGIRTEKTVNGVTTKYTVFGDKVSFETTGPDKIHYSYDASGNLFSMNLNGTEYYYVRNAQGDITGLIDNAGNLVVSYTYDTWGKLISTTGSLASTIGVKNPYRYRGYRYDTETGLYYLQSRYYNPDWDRFVNADAYGGKAGTLLSHNMFGYALNNPVNMDDPSGHFPKWATGLLTIAGGISAIIAGAALGATVAWTGIGAAAAGFLIVNGLGTFASGIAQVSNSIANTHLHEENILRTVSKTTGRVVGGSIGEKVSTVIYDAADTAASLYSIVGGGSTALAKTVSALGKQVSITKTFTLFAQPSKFTNPYVVKMALGMERIIHLPKPWFRVVNGIGALADGLLSGGKLHSGLINIFGGK
jgi:RHS repeat-associated protein